MGPDQGPNPYPHPTQEKMEVSTEKATLSVVVITKNEEEDLPGLIEHLLHWVNEIIVVDDGSTDSTVDVAESYGDKVRVLRHLRSQEEGFAGQRNHGIENANSEWVLNMDADERVPPDLGLEIIKRIQEAEFGAFRYRRKNFFLHRPMKGGGWTTWNNVQLARRRKHYYVNPLHERCVVDADVRVGQLEASMWHLNDESYVERISKSVQYSLISAESILERGRRVTVLDLLFRPFAIFVRNYILRRGLIDGIAGLISAMHSAGAEFRAQAIVWDRQNTISRSVLETQISDAWRKGRESKELDEERS